jgi:hypothetical protein
LVIKDGDKGGFEQNFHGQIVLVSKRQFFNSFFKKEAVIMGMSELVGCIKGSP